jgi:Flp pilus assembly protein TadD
VATTDDAPPATTPPAAATNTETQGDDLLRGELTSQDLNELEAALDSVDFATRKATPELLARLRALSARLVDLVEQIEKGVRKRTDDAPLKPEDEEKLKALFDEGVAAGEKGELDRARSKLEEALRLDSESPEVLFNLGVVYGLLSQANFARGEFYDSRVRDEVWAEKGVFCYERLLELEPDNTHALNNLATLYDLQGERDVAVETLVKSLKVKADQEDAKRHLDELDPDGELRKSLESPKA